MGAVAEHLGQVDLPSQALGRFSRLEIATSPQPGQIGCLDA